MNKDPTLVVNGVADDANGPTPEPLQRYGEPLHSSWVPLYKKPMRTPTRKVRIACIGAGISAMNLAYKIYHEWRETLGDSTELVFYEANEDLGGTWLVNTYPGVACDVPAHIYTFPFEVRMMLPVPRRLPCAILTAWSQTLTGHASMLQEARSWSTSRMQSQNGISPETSSVAIESQRHSGAKRTGSGILPWTLKLDLSRIRVMSSSPRWAFFRSGVGQTYLA